MKSKVRCSARQSSTTPRLLAKCAERRAHDADQLVAHLVGEPLELLLGQLLEVGRRADPGQKRLGAASSTIPFQKMPAPGRGAGGPALSERRQRRDGLLGELPGPRRGCPRPPGIGGRSICRSPESLPTRLPSLASSPSHVEQVVDDLERQADAAAVAVQGLAVRLRRPAAITAPMLHGALAAGRRSCGGGSPRARPASRRRRVGARCSA